MARALQSSFGGLWRPRARRRFLTRSRESAIILYMIVVYFFGTQRIAPSFLASARRTAIKVAEFTSSSLLITTTSIRNAEAAVNDDMGGENSCPSTPEFFESTSSSSELSASSSMASEPASSTSSSSTSESSASSSSTSDSSSSGDENTSNEIGEAFTNWFLMVIGVLRISISLFNAAMVIHLRKESPFSLLHVPIILTAEAVYLLMGISRFFRGLELLEIYSDSPWFFQLDQLCVFYGIIFYLDVYFPFCSSIILNAVHLRIDHQTAYDSVHRPTSLFCRYKSLLKSHWLYAGLSVMLLAMGCPSTVVLLAETRAKYWFSNYNDESLYPCPGDDYTALCNENDKVFSTDLGLTFTWFGMMMFCIAQIAKVQDAFGVKRALMIAGVAAASANVFCNVYAMLATSVEVYGWGPSTMFYALSLMVSQLAFPFSTIILTINKQREMERFLNITISSRRSSTSAVSGDNNADAELAFTQKVIKKSDLISLLHKYLDTPALLEFQEYLVTEFCAENLLFLRSSLPLRQEDYAVDTRKKVNWELALKHFAPQCVDPINVPFSLSTKIMATVADEGGSPTFWSKVEEEIAGMLLSPYNRFAMLKKGKAESSSVAPKKKEAMISGKKKVTVAVS